MARRTREISVSTTSQSTERRAPDPEPNFSLAVLARSWAEVTGETWENILYRVGDWAITDAFPDDAFRTADADDATFHKQVIFDRVRWHRDLVDKIRRAQDPRKKERLQRFADLHMQAVEIAVLRRDVVVEACRAMNVVPPPILGLIEGCSATHRVPPECPPDFPIGVYAREAEQDQAWRHHGDVMAPDETDKYTLLWDAAREMSRHNGRDVEWNWLRLMDAFWRGDLARAGLAHFYRGSEPGREFVTHNRDALAGLLLGWRPLVDRTHEPAHPIDTLRHWNVADYRGQPAPLGDYFEHDPEGRVGLAVQTRELDRWRHGATGTTSSVNPSDDKQIDSTSRTRGAYSAELELWMAPQDLAVLRRMGAAAIARRFKSYCEESLPRTVPLLPKRPRSIENMIDRIIERRAETARTRAPLKAASERPIRAKKDR